MQAETNRRWLADTSPWFLAELEMAEVVLGMDWQAHGLEPNRRMIQTLCQEVFAQGLVAEPLDCTTVFQDFEEMMRGEMHA